MVGGGDGWQKLMGPMDGSGGWLGEKNSKKKIVPNELMSPKKTTFLFLFLSVFF